MTYQGRLKEAGIPVTGNRQVDLKLCDAPKAGTCNVVSSQGVSVSNGLFRSTFTVPVGVDLTAGVWYLEVVVGGTTLSPREQLTAAPYAIYASTAATVSAGAIDTSKLAADAVTFSKIAGNGCAPNDVIKWNGSAWACAVDATSGASLTSGTIWVGNGSNLPIERTISGDATIDNAGVLAIGAAKIDTGKLANDAVTFSKIARNGCALNEIIKWNGNAWACATDATSGATLTNGKIWIGSVGNVPVEQSVSGDATLDNAGLLTIAAGKVDTGKLASDAVTTPKIADQAITTAKVGFSAIDTNRIAADAIISAKIAAGAVGTLKLAADAVTSSAILTAAVNTSKLANDAVTFSKIAGGGCSNGQVLGWNGSAWGCTSAGGPPSGSAGGDLTGTYPNPLIAPNAIDTGKLNSGAVDTTKLNNDAVLAKHILAGAVQTSKIAADAVVGSAIAAGAVDTAKLFADAVDTAKIRSDSIVAAKIADNAIGTKKLAQDAVDTFRILDGAVNANKIGAGAVTTPKLAAFSVDTGKLANDAVTFAKIAGGGCVSGTVMQWNGSAWTCAASPGGPPSGLAGGDLTGAYPNPAIAAGKVDTGKLAADAVDATKIVDGSVNTAEVATDAVTSAKILNFAVINAKIAALAVDTGKIASDAVTTAKVSDGAVQTAKLANDAVTFSKIAGGGCSNGQVLGWNGSAWGCAPAGGPPSGSAGGDLTGSYPNPSIANGRVDTLKIASDAVDSTKILDGSVNTAKLANDSVTSAKLVDSGVAAGNYGSASQIPQLTIDKKGRITLANTQVLSIDTAKLATDAVDSTKILNGAVGSAKIAIGAIDTSSKFLAGVVDANAIAAGAVTATKIASGVVNTSKIAVDAVDSTKILDGSVSTNKLANDSVTTQKISDGAVDSAKLAANAVTSSKIVGGAVDTAKLAACPAMGALTWNGAAWFCATPGSAPTGPAGGDLTGTYPNPSIGFGMVDSAKLAVNSVDTTKLAAGVVNTFKIATDAVDSTKIITAAVATSKIAADAVDATKILDGAVNTNKLGPNSVTTVKIAPLAVDTTKIAPAAVDTTKIAADAVDTAKIRSDSITTVKIADGAVTIAKMASLPVIVAPGSAQNDSSAASSIFINKTAPGNLMQLQASGVDRFVVTNTGHVKIGGGTPGAVPAGTNCTGVSVTAVSGTDAAAKVTVSGSMTAGNCAINVSFANAYGTAPKAVMITPGNSAGSQANPFATNVAAGGFTIDINTASGAGPIWYFLVIE